MSGTTVTSTRKGVKSRAPEMSSRSGESVDTSMWIKGTRRIVLRREYRCKVGTERLVDVVIHAVIHLI
jgi:hypothetical protein